MQIVWGVAQSVKRCRVLKPSLMCFCVSCHALGATARQLVCIVLKLVKADDHAGHRTQGPACSCKSESSPQVGFCAYVVSDHASSRVKRSFVGDYSDTLSCHAVGLAPTTTPLLSLLSTLLLGCTPLPAQHPCPLVPTTPSQPLR